MCTMSLADWEAVLHNLALTFVLTNDTLLAKYIYITLSLPMSARVDIETFSIIHDPFHDYLSWLLIVLWQISKWSSPY